MLSGSSILPTSVPMAAMGPPEATLISQLAFPARALIAALAATTWPMLISLDSSQVKVWMPPGSAENRAAPKWFICSLPQLSASIAPAPAVKGTSAALPMVC